MAIMIQKRDGRREVLDISLIQKMTIEVAEQLSTIAETINKAIDYALKKSLLMEYKLKRLQQGQNKQLLITHIKLLTNQPKNDTTNSILTIKIFLKNIFGQKNTSESDNNK